MKITDNKYIIIILFASLFGLLIFKPYFLEQPTGKYIAPAPSVYGYGGEPCPSGIPTASPCPEGQYCCQTDEGTNGKCAMIGDGCCKSLDRAAGYNRETSKCCIAMGDSDFQPIEIIAYDEVCCEEKVRTTGKCARGEKCCYSGDFLSHACMPPAGTCCRTYTTAEGCAWGVECCQSTKRQEIGEISYPLAASCKMSGAACCESEETRVSQMFCATGQVCCKTPDGDATCYDQKEGTCCKGQDEYGKPVVCTDGKKCCDDGYGDRTVCYDEDPPLWYGPYTCCHVPDANGDPLICDEGQKCCTNYVKTIGACIDEDDDCCELKGTSLAKCEDPKDCCVNLDSTDARCFDPDAGWGMDECCGDDGMTVCDEGYCCVSGNKRVAQCIKSDNCCIWETGVGDCKKANCCVSGDGKQGDCCGITDTCCQDQDQAFCMPLVVSQTHTCSSVENGLVPP
ncbi:MAG: hypothetical protein ABH851_04130 [Methanobacteriota archaeon]